jgi:hypothetical protein
MDGLKQKSKKFDRVAFDDAQSQPKAANVSLIV